MSMRSCGEPCGSWQLVQLSRTAACSCRNGPRFSVWQLMHDSFSQLPTLSSLTLTAPCGLWHDEHSILPSVTGMCEARRIFAACCWWQVWHSCRLRLGLQLALERLRGVDAVARGAREVAGVVRAAIPERVRALGVAGQARLVAGARIDLRVAEAQDLALVVVVHVGLAGTVAALAASCWPSACADS